MRITGIITEYNPLHLGHKYHIEESKKITNADGIVCVMSGNFMQRGIPAIIDKWNRTKMALENGVDLVIELPVIYSLSSAEFFAHGAVSLLDSMGVVNSLCFGSEVGDIGILNKIAHILTAEPEGYKNLLHHYLSQSYSFPKSRNLALNDYIKSLNDADISLNSMLASSNNILGVEYCKSLIKLNSSIIPYTINRIGSNYNTKTLESSFSSATAIRSHLKQGNTIQSLKKQLPSSVLTLINQLEAENYSFVYEDVMYPYIKYKIMSEGDTLINIPDASEGLNNKIVECVKNSNDYHEMIGAIKSKRYAYTRLCRILCQYFVGFEKYDTKSLRSKSSPYGKILGFNTVGAKILKNAKKNTSIPLYTKMPKQNSDTLNIDIQATEVYSLINSKVDYNSDFTISPIIINK